MIHLKDKENKEDQKSKKMPYFMYIQKWTQTTRQQLGKNTNIPYAENITLLPLLATASEIYKISCANARTLRASSGAFAI